MLSYAKQMDDSACRISSSEWVFFISLNFLCNHRIVTRKACVGDSDLLKQMFCSVTKLLEVLSISSQANDFAQATLSNELLSVGKKLIIKMQTCKVAANTLYVPLH